MKYEKYQEIAENYFNGNISDFRNALKRLSKKQIITLAGIMAEYFSPVSYMKANETIYKYLD